MENVTIRLFANKIVLNQVDVMKKLFVTKTVIKFVDIFCNDNGNGNLKMGETLTKELMDFLKSFKNAVDSKFEQSEAKSEVTTRKLESHLGNIDSNMMKMKIDLEKMEEKNKQETERLNNRLATLEEDMRRMHYAKLKSPTRMEEKTTGMTVLPLAGKSRSEDQREGRREDDRREEIVAQPAGMTSGRIRNTDQRKEDGPTVSEKGVTEQPLQSSWMDERSRELAAAAKMGRDRN